MVLMLVVALAMPRVLPAEGPVQAAKGEMAVTYSNDFESVCDMQLFAHNIDKHDLRYLGLTPEKSAHGKSSLKLDFSVPAGASGHYIFWIIRTPRIPLRDPTYVSVSSWPTAGGGRIGFEFYAPAPKKATQPYFAKQFNASQKNWAEIHENAYPLAKDACEKEGWDMDGTVVTGVYLQISGKPPFEITWYLDDLVVDYVQHNPEAFGRPMSDLYRIVKKKIEEQRIQLKKYLTKVPNPAAEAEAQKLWREFESAEATMKNLPNLDEEQLADLRIRLDELPAKQGTLLEKLRREDLLN